MDYTTIYIYIHHNTVYTGKVVIAKLTPVCVLCVQLQIPHTPTGSRQCFTWRNIWQCAEERRSSVASLWSPMRKTLWVLLYKLRFILSKFKFGTVTPMIIMASAFNHTWQSEAAKKLLISWVACHVEDSLLSVGQWSNWQKQKQQHILLLTMSMCFPTRAVEEDIV